ncbi:MAG TPA: tetratricopeptide repeat protein [Candidatus Angelobacter sp.]|nr:tetratricopeptide repeat protein [Candidatus Angelobacter sp.]
MTILDQPQGTNLNTESSLYAWGLEILAEIRCAHGESEEACQLLLKRRDLQLRMFGSNSPWVANTYFTLADALEGLDNLSKKFDKRPTLSTIPSFLPLRRSCRRHLEASFKSRIFAKIGDGQAQRIDLDQIIRNRIAEQEMGGVAIRCLANPPAAQAILLTCWSPIKHDEVQMLRKAALILVTGISLAFLQCGGSSNTSSTANAPSPNPGSTTPARPDSYLATVICCVISRSPTVVGQTTVDASANNGAGVWPSVGTSNGVTMVLKFCPYNSQSVNNCLNVATYTSGGGNVNFTFPAKGAFAGSFLAFVNGDNTDEEVYTASGASSGLNFESAMLPAGTITGGIGQATGNAPGSGVLTATSTTAHLTLTGTLANHTFQVSICGLNASDCRFLSNITTDTQGSASADVGTLRNQDNDSFLVGDSSGVEFISAFRVQ